MPKLAHETAMPYANNDVDDDDYDDGDDDDDDDDDYDDDDYLTCISPARSGHPQGWPSGKEGHRMSAISSIIGHSWGNCFPKTWKYLQ